MRLHEVARVFDGVENDKTGGRIKGDSRAVFVSMQRQPGTNTVEIVDAIRALLPALRAQLPASVSLDVRNDRSKSIRESVDDVKFTLVLTMGLVVLVIFLFLRNVSRHHHSQPGAAGVGRRHVRRDVCASASASTTCR